MNSYRQILYHIVFCTHNRAYTLPAEYHTSLYKYIWGIVKKRHGVLYQINGTENHIHILCDLHPTETLSDFIKEIKVASHRWMKESQNFPLFEKWSEGYCALTYAWRDKDMISKYIRNQKAHHQKKSFETEYRSLLQKWGVVPDERYIF